MQLTRLEKDMLKSVLEGCVQDLLNNGCNDLPIPSKWTVEEREQFLQDYDKKIAQEKGAYPADWVFLSYIKDLI